MASGSVSVHGHGIHVGIIPEKLILSCQPAFARVENVTSTDITPNAYFPLPNPQKETPTLVKIQVEFSGGDVTVTNVGLYIGASTIFTRNISKNSSFAVDIPQNQGAVYTGQGLSVGLGLKIPGRKYIDFESVSIVTSGP